MEGCGIAEPDGRDEDLGHDQGSAEGERDRNSDGGIYREGFCADAAAGFLWTGMRSTGTAGGQRGWTGRADAGGGMRDWDGITDADGGDAGRRAAFGANISEGSGDIEDGDCRVAAGDRCEVCVEREYTERGYCVTDDGP